MPEDSFFKRTYVCRYCLEEYKTSLLDPPLECTACKIGQCSRCGSYLKKDAFKICYGCATINPTVNFNFIASDGTSYLYFQQAWMNKNRGINSILEQDSLYCISYKQDGVFITVRFPSGTYLDVRKLTPQEIDLLKSKDT